LGHSHPALAEALCRQARTLIQTSNQFYTVPQLELARLLVQHSCLQRVFFANSGAEANEGAVKLARKYGKRRLKGAYTVITTDHSFHGRTLAMVAATGKPAYQKDYVPLPAGFVNVPYNDVDAIARAITDETCAVMLEPIQGEGGVNVPDERYLADVRQLCKDRGILFILDEIQTGVGRTGTLWAYEQFGVEPDVMTLAKGLGGGVPIGAILCKEEVSVFEPGDHGSTFGGNPLACAAAVAVMREVLDRDLPAHVRRVGERLATGLRRLQDRHPVVREVRGRGLLQAVEFDQEIAPKVQTAALERGMLLNVISPTTVRLMPPLVISETEVDQALDLLDQSIAAAVQ
ncbi:MAG TPA: aspartate aminotransferase family protein, partial [Chloroflexota bacterium]